MELTCISRIKVLNKLFANLFGSLTFLPYLCSQFKRLTHINMDIQSIIKEKGFTQNQVAEALGVSKSSLSQSVHNDNTSVKMMKRIAEVIGCKVGDFFRDELDASPADGFVCPHCGKPLNVKVEA